MSELKLGDKAPNFDAETSEGKINFYDYLGDSWEFYFRTLPIIHRFVPPN